MHTLEHAIPIQPGEITNILLVLDSTNTFLVSLVRNTIAPTFICHPLSPGPLQGQTEAIWVMGLVHSQIWKHRKSEAVHQTQGFFPHSENVPTVLHYTCVWHVCEYVCWCAGAECCAGTEKVGGVMVSDLLWNPVQQEAVDSGLSQHACGEWHFLFLLSVVAKLCQKNSAESKRLWCPCLPAVLVCVWLGVTCLCVCVGGGVCPYGRKKVNANSIVPKERHKYQFWIKTFPLDIVFSCLCHVHLQDRLLHLFWTLLIYLAAAASTLTRNCTSSFTLSGSSVLSMLYTGAARHQYLAFFQATFIITIQVGPFRFFLSQHLVNDCFGGSVFWH